MGKAAETRTDEESESHEGDKITGTKGDADTGSNDTTTDPSTVEAGDADDDADSANEDAGDGRRAVELPADVRRYVRRPWLWVPWALVLGAMAYALQVDTGQADEWVYGTGEPLTAVVAEEYEGLLVPLVYEHPVAGMTTVAIPNPDSDNPPEPGQTIAIRAHQTFPEQVRLANDTPDPAQWWTILVPVGMVALVVLRRWWSARRTASAMSADGSDDEGAPVEMVARLRPRRRWGRTVVLDLYDASKPTELPKRPSISVPLVSTLGLPIGGRTFKVTVHGRPRRFGRVVAEVEDGVLWPRRRGLLRPRVPRDLDSVADRPSRALRVAGLESRRLKAPKQLWPEERLRTLGALGLVGAAVLVGVLSTTTSLSARDDARQLPDGARQVPATVTGISDTGLLQVEHQDPDNPSGDGVEATVGREPVTNPTAFSLGAPVVVVVEPGSAGRVTLPPAPYRVGAPIVGGWIPAVLAGAWLMRIRGWRRRRQAAGAEGATWYPVEVGWLKEPIVAEVRRPRSKAPSCVVTFPWGIEEMPISTTDKLVDRRQPVYAHVPPAPGETLVLRTAGRAYVTVTPTTLRDQRWRRRWRFIGRRK